ncbi:hypothetical protein CAPTEDRAFT_192321 [Capitella teleta]|uniref:Glycosyltransferase family 92 protein n=1 Tax=Capitella teleta TaxID=283909 RepID=R7UCM9_CAPTE|nr:hypothetical protein CAPTEDRAFT_192321 [Capitella teleta]|eukprot:ELU03754.1 hypothetical protein CAPTEDRAFT_192321 [Capitella teleta]
MKRRNICSVHSAGVLGAIVLGIQLGVFNLFQVNNHSTNADEVGDTLYYGRDKLGIRYADYAKSTVYKLVLKPGTSNAATCSGSSYRLHDVGGLPIRKVGLMQTLGDTNVHALSAVLDDRVSDRPMLRILAAGLHPGPGDKVYCNYKCIDEEVPFCSIEAHGVILLAGNHTDYIDEHDRKSLMNVMSLACAVRYDDTPDEVSLTTKQCGFSHNVLPVRSLNVSRGVMIPSRDVGICVRPFTMSALEKAAMTPEHLALWLEYLRLLRADKVHIYTSVLDDRFSKVLKFYQQESFSIADLVDWKAADEQLDEVVSDEAAINHCIYNQLTAYDNIIVMSVEEWLVFSGKFHDLKELVRHPEFRAKRDAFGGFRIRSPLELKRQMYIVNPMKILGSAARHFVALSGKPSFRVLETTDLLAVQYKDRKLSDSFRKEEVNLMQLLGEKDLLES